MITDPKRFLALLNKNLTFAGHRVGAEGVARVSDILSSRPNPPIVRQAPLTVAIKGKASPLVDKLNRISRSTAYDQPSPGVIRIGSRIRADNGRDITRALHYGFTFDLSLKKYRKMRTWLMRTIQELKDAGKLGRGGPIRGPKGRKGFIVIPARPWLGHVFESDSFVNFVVAAQGAALQATMRGINLRTRGNGAP